MTTKTSSSTIDQSELQKFNRMAEEWWSPNGKFKPLHQLNNCRLHYLRNQICANFELDDTLFKPLANLEVLDVGCGGGLICEPMARMGANVTGIDADSKTIGIAQAHLNTSTGISIDYQCASIENLKPKNKQFDVVFALEIVEHVDNLPLFLKATAQRVKTGGILFVSTLNRTSTAYLKAIIGAEYVLGLLPRGTHQWQKFVKPVELVDILAENDMRATNLSGMVFDIFQQKWRSHTRNLSVNYIATFKQEAL